MSGITLEAFLDFAKEVDAQYNERDARNKPRIKFYGNGDVYIECYNIHRTCYPNAQDVTFRTPFMPFASTFTVSKVINA